MNDHTHPPMNRLQSLFNRMRVLLPVIHAVNAQQCYAQATRALKAGADGLFFINQGGMDPLDMVRLAADVGTQNSQTFVGVNLLGSEPAFAAGSVLVYDSIRMLWSDSGEPFVSQTFTEHEFHGAPARLYFGGVAFKGQPDSGLDAQDAGLAAGQAAAAGLDVITTSGPGTGHPTPRSKVKAMRFVLGDHPLAVASGVALSNVDELLPYVDAYLCASSLETSFGVFDEGRVRELADRLHEWRP